MPNCRIALVTKNRINPAYQGARIGAERTAATLGATIDFLAPETPDDVDEQRALLETALADPPAGFIVNPGHASALDPVLRRIKDQGIPLVFIVGGTAEGEADCAIGADDRALAAAIAAYLIASLGGAGDLFVVDGNPDAATGPPRALGFRDAISAAPECRIVAALQGNLLCKL
jgi:ribose transport system substrate-binding protein